jgi:hypothetical protein
MPSAVRPVPRIVSEIGSGTVATVLLNDPEMVPVAWLAVKIHVPGVGSNPVNVAVPASLSVSSWNPPTVVSTGAESSEVSVKLTDMPPLVPEKRRPGVNGEKVSGDATVMQLVQDPNAIKLPDSVVTASGLTNVTWVEVNDEPPLTLIVLPAAIGTAFAPGARATAMARVANPNSFFMVQALCCKLWARNNSVSISSATLTTQYFLFEPGIDGPRR